MLPHPVIKRGTSSKSIAIKSGYIPANKMETTHMAQEYTINTRSQKQILVQKKVVNRILKY